MPLWKQKAKTDVKWPRELSESLRAMAEDLREHYVLWLSIIGAIIPAVFTALTISSNSSRLTATLQASAVFFQQASGTAQVSPEEYDAGLEAKIRAVLEGRITSIFQARGTQRGSEGDKTNDGDFLDAGMRLVKVIVRVRSEITNIGNRPSSLQSVDWYVFEEIDGRREWRDFAFQKGKRIGLPQGQPIQLVPENGDTVEFGLIGATWTDYEVVRVLSQRIRGQIPKGQNLYPNISPYLEVLTINEPFHRDRVLRIADPNHHSRLIYGVRVSDIYGRTASAETVWLDSSNFNRGR
jgi:hypothetical protein